MRRSLILVLLLSLPAWVSAAVAPSNRMVLRDPTTNVRIVTGNVRFYASGRDTTQATNQVDFDVDATTSTWDNDALTMAGDSIRAGYYDGYWRHGVTRALVAREWLNGAKARSASVDWAALQKAVQDSIQAGGSGGGGGTGKPVGVLRSTGLGTIDSLAVTKQMLYIEDGGIGARQLADGCLSPAKLDQSGSDTGTSDHVYVKNNNGDGYWLLRSALGGGGGGGSGDITDVGAWNRTIVVHDSTGGANQPAIEVNVDINEVVNADSFLVFSGNPPYLHVRKGDGNTGGVPDIPNPLPLGSASEAGEIRLHNASVGGSDFVYSIMPSETLYGDEGSYPFYIPANAPSAGRVLVSDGNGSRWRTYLSMEGSGNFSGGGQIGSAISSPCELWGGLSLGDNTSTATIANGADSTGIDLSWVTKSMRAYAWWTASRTASGATPAPPSQTVYAMTRTGRISIRASGTVTGNREVTYMVFLP